MAAAGNSERAAVVQAMLLAAMIGRLVTTFESERNVPDSMRTTFVVFAFLGLTFAISSCDGNTAGEAIPQEARLAAREKWDKFCIMCHGSAGRGDGPTAAALTPKPRNHSDQSWQATVTDDQIETVILKGGAAIGLSPVMPPSTDLEGKPLVVKALREIVRGWAR